MFGMKTLTRNALGLWLAATVSTFAQAPVAPASTPVSPPEEVAPEAAPAPEKPAVTVSNDLFAASASTNAVPSAPTIDLPPAAESTEGIEIEQSAENTDKISVTLDDVPLKDVIRMFSRISGANIVAMDDLEGRVTVSLNDVSWKDALEAILDQAQLVLVEKKQGIYSVIRRADLASEPLVVEAIKLNFMTVSNVLPIVRTMLVSTNASVTTYPAANMLIITETTMQITKIRKVIAEMDKPRDQVYIEAKFVELNDSAIEDLGVNWQSLQNFTVTAGEMTRNYTRTRRSNRTSTPGTFSVENQQNSSTRQSTDQTESTFSRNRDSTTGNTSANGVTGTSDDTRDNFSRRDTSVANVLVQGNNFEAFNIDEQGAITIETIPANDVSDVRSAVLSASEFALTLSMLKQLDGASVISNPKLLVSNGEQAMIHVGRNEPNIVAMPQGDQGNQYVYQLDSRTPFIEIGIKLKVRPTINTPENITIKVEPELSRLLGQKTAGEANTSFPITQVRRIHTEFNVESGKTVAIGGLTETTDKDAVKKVPVLGDIPIIGKYLFTHRHDEAIQDEVIIFVTVEMANPKQIKELSGLPAKGRLIHKHLEAEAMEKSKVEGQASADVKTPAKSPSSDIDRILDQIKKEKAPAAANPAPPTSAETQPAAEAVEPAAPAPVAATP